MISQWENAVKQQEAQKSKRRYTLKNWCEYWLVFVDVMNLRKTQMERSWVVLIAIMEDRIMMMNGVNLQERMLNNHRNEILTLDNLFANNFY